MRARRALIYTPGDDMHKIRKAANMDVDCICLDMEDGVAPNRKTEARRVIVEALNTLDFGRSERLVRINSVGSGLEVEDLENLRQVKPDALVIPKVEYAEHIRWASSIIAGYEDQNGWPKNSIPLLVGVETALGVINLPQIAAADPRLEAIIFGAEDFAGDIGATRTKEGWEIFYARSAVVTHAAAYGLQAIDMVYVDYHDVEGLRREALEGVHMAYTGKQIIHPAQIAPVQEAFTPSDEAIAHARRIKEAFDQHQEAGVGVFGLDGKMVDAPIVKAAERVLVLARAAGKIKD